MDNHLSDAEAAAAELLDAYYGARAGGDRSEADVVHCVQRLLEVAGVIEPGEARLEKDYVDLQTARVVFEVKKRVGTQAGGIPDVKNILQLDRYLQESIDKGERHKLGVLTDGKYWIARFPSEIGGPVQSEEPYVFTLHDAELVGDWIDWLTARTQILPLKRSMPGAVELGEAFGQSLVAKDLLRSLQYLYAEHRWEPTVEVKRVLWQDLLGVALGEAG